MRRHPAPPGGVHACRQSAGEQNEGNHDQPDQGADQQTEYEGELVFPSSEAIHPTDHLVGEREARMSGQGRT